MYDKLNKETQLTSLSSISTGMHVTNTISQFVSTFCYNPGSCVQVDVIDHMTLFNGKMLVKDARKWV